MNSTIVAAIIAAGGVFITTLLTFFLWWRDTKRRRAKELEISTALYINPFIDACEQLQSRIFNVFQLSGLVALKQQYKDDKHAYEMLFQLARYCGWERIVRRYASHTLDQETINLLEDVRIAFSKSSDQKWRFYREEQKTLGQFAVRRVPNAEHEFEEVQFYKFVSELKSGALAEMTSAHQAINSICAAGEIAENIDGKERLKQAQSKLIEILNRLEKVVHYSVFKDDRQRLV